MFLRNRRCAVALAAILLAASTGNSLATEQAQQRRAGRDVRQETRQGAPPHKTGLPRCQPEIEPAMQAG